jgi:hypothetical protein
VGLEELDCSELLDSSDGIELETSEEDNNVEVETLDDWSELLDSDNIELEPSDDDDKDVEETWNCEEEEEVEMGKLGRVKEEEYVEEAIVEDK